jgi:hypothetical protein
MSRKAAEQYCLLSSASFKVDEAMSLFNCGVSRSEAELMVRYEVGMFN